MNETSAQGAPSDTTPPPPPLPPPPGPRRLTRRRDGEIAGVAGGLADYLGIDPVIVRVAFVVLAITGGFGLLLYIVLWIATPEADAPQSVGESAFRRFGDAPTWVQIAAVLGVGFVLVTQIGTGRVSVAWAVVLIALGVVLFRQGGQEPAAAGTNLAQQATASGMTSGGPVGGPATQGPAGLAAPLAPPPPPARPVPVIPTRPPSVLGQLTLGVALLVVGGAAALHNLGTVDLATRDYLALATVVIGLGLLVGAFFGRARWLALVALALLPPLVLTGVVDDLRFSGEVGERRWRPEALAEVEDEYRLFAGDLLVDLTDVDFSQARQPVPIAVELTFGQATVIVPDDVDVDVSGRLRGGESMVLGELRTGLGITFDTVSTITDPEAMLELDVNTGFGDIIIERDSGGQ